MSVLIEPVRLGITTCFLHRGDGAVVVDPAGPPGGARARRRLLPRLGTPPRLDLIVVTHVTSTTSAVSVLLPTGEALVGDLAMKGLPLCLRPSLSVFAHEPARMPESWRRLFALGMRTAFPAHGRPFAASALGL